MELPITVSQFFRCHVFGSMLLLAQPIVALNDCCTEPFAPQTCYSNEPPQTYKNESGYECYAIERSNHCQSCILSDGYGNDECSRCCAFERSHCSSTESVSSNYFSSNYVIELVMVLLVLIFCLLCMSTGCSENRRPRTRAVHARGYYTDSFQQGERVTRMHQSHQQPGITHLTVKTEDEVIASGGGGGLLGFGGGSSLVPTLAVPAYTEESDEETHEETILSSSSPLLSGPL